MRISLGFSLIAAVLIGLSATQPIPAQPLAPKQFDQLRKVIRPQSGEDKWEEIAWRADLWEARKEAAVKGKPLLLWEMDGNPLGCT
jgi:hypothetical protein